MPEHNRGELRRRDASQIGLNQRRFPDPPGARDGHQALAGGNPRLHGFQSRFMTRAQKEKGRVGGDLEGSTFETVKIEIHTHTNAPRAMLPRAPQTENLSARQNALGNYTRSGYPGCRPQRPTAGRLVEVWLLCALRKLLSSLYVELLGQVHEIIGHHGK